MSAPDLPNDLLNGETPRRWAHHDDTQYQRVFIGQQRAKIEPDPNAPTLIKIKPGAGDRFAEAKARAPRQNTTDLRRFLPVEGQVVTKPS